MSRLAPVAAALVVASMALASCDDGATSTRPTTTSAPLSPRPTETEITTASSPPSSEVPFSEIGVTLTEVAAVDAPVALAPRSGTDDLYVAERAGRVRVLRRTDDRNYSVDEAPALDIEEMVANQEGERGLLGLTFSPDGEWLFVNYTDGNDSGTSVIARYRMDGAVADAASRTELLTVPQPFSNHNGGNLAFGPDGYLYLGFGDGGSQGDPNSNAQNNTTLLGSMLRIDVLTEIDTGSYSIPADNPFVSVPGARREIWSTGLRNPWRFSFDRATGDLWIADVGGSDWEEIDLARSADGGGRGLNFGWNLREGAHDTGLAADPDLDSVDPIFEYDHREGSSVTGGYVYRGAAIADLSGIYVYSDFTTAELRALRVADGELRSSGTLQPGGESVNQVVSFGEDNDGELYVLELSGSVLRIDPS